MRITADMHRRRIIGETKILELKDLFNHFKSKHNYNAETETNNAEQRLLKSLSRLYPKQKQVLRLVFYHDFKIGEV
jgi:DNA-directed RNA polymerase specialized sigma24 family protein